MGWGGWRKGRARCLAVVRLITPNEKVQIPKCMYTHERLMYKSLPEETERLNVPGVPGDGVIGGRGPLHTYVSSWVCEFAWRCD